MFQMNPHMKNQALFSSKGKSKKLKCPLLQFLFGTFKVMFDVKLGLYWGLKGLHMSETEKSTKLVTLPNSHRL